LAKAIPFNPKYLLGFISREYTIALQDGFNRAKRKSGDSWLLGLEPGLEEDFGRENPTKGRN